MPLTHRVQVLHWNQHNGHDISDFAFLRRLIWTFFPHYAPNLRKKNVINGTGNVHTRTIAEIAQQLSFKENPQMPQHTRHSRHKHKQSTWQYTYTHMNGSHLCPKSWEAISLSSAEKQQSKQRELITTTRKQRPMTHITDRIVESTKRRRVSGVG